MGELDLLGKSTTTELKTGVPNYSVSYKSVDEAGASKETEWLNSNWSKYLGYYKSIPELKQALDALAIWTAGKGWTAESTLTKTYLDMIRGWGEDSFDSIMRNMIVTKKLNGDAYAEIITHNGKPLKEGGKLINLKPLNPGRMKNIVNDKGIIIRYEEFNNKGEVVNKFRPEEIFHIVNDRIANEIHGISIIESCQGIIDFNNEVLADVRRVLHRSTIRVLYVDEDNAAKLASLRTQYKEAIKNGEVLILPGKPQDASFQDLQVPPVQIYLDWKRYLEDYFYRAVGTPKIILGGAQEYTEASSKVGYLTFEQVYMAEQRLLEQDIWNQLGLKITFDRPVSLKEPVQSSEQANTGQVGFQPNETETQMGRTE